MTLKESASQFSGHPALDQGYTEDVSASHAFPILPEGTRQELATHITGSIRTLLTSLHPSLGRGLSPLNSSDTPAALFDACEVNLTLFRNFRELLPASCLTADTIKSLNKTEEALTTVKYFSERVSRPDAYEKEDSATTVAFIASTLTQLHATFSTTEQASLLELAARIPPPTLPVIQPEGPPAEQPFVPPETVVTRADLPREPSALAKFARQAEQIADERILSPLESFLARHQKTAVAAATSIVLGAGSTILYLYPTFAVSISAAAAVGVCAAATIPGVAKCFKWLAGRSYSKRVSYQKKTGASVFGPEDLSMPEKRTVSLGSKASKRSRQDTSSASALSDTAAQDAKAFQSNRLDAHTELFRSRMGVTAIYVTAGSAGQVQRFDRFCQEHDAANPDAPSMLDDWYPERSVPAELPYADDDIQGRISFSTGPGKQSFPLPAGFCVSAIEFYDSEGNTLSLPEGIHIREALLGGFSAEIPPGVERVQYAVRAGNTHIDQEKINRLLALIPAHPCFIPDQELFLQANLEQFVTDPGERAHIDYITMIEAGLTYTMDPLVSAMQKRAGRALSETLLGMGMGICDSFAYTTARRMNNINLPALLIAGLVVEQKENGESAYDTKNGHAQTVLPTTSGPVIFDATIHAAPDTIDSGKVSWTERATALLTVNAGTFRDAFEVSQHLGARLRGDIPEQALESGWWQPLYRLWHAGLVPDPREHYAGDHAGHSLSENFDIRNAERGLARALLIKSYDEGLKRATSLGLQHNTLEPLYAYLRKPLTAKIERYEIDDLPEALQKYAGYDPVKEAIAFTNTALLEQRLSAEGHDISFNWLFSRFPSPFAAYRVPLPDYEPPANPAFSLSEASQYANEPYLALMTPEQRFAYAQALLGTAVSFILAKDPLGDHSLEDFYNGNSTHSIVKIIEADTASITQFCQSLHTALRSLKSELSYTPPFVLTRMIETIGSIGTGIGYARFRARREKPPELEYQSQQLLHCQALLLNALPDWADTLMDALDDLRNRDAYHSLAPQTPDGKHLAELLTAPDRNQSSTQYFEFAVVADRLTRLDPAKDYKSLTRNARDLGFPDFSLAAHQTTIEAAVLAMATRVRSAERCNLPAPEHPLSSLAYSVCITPGTRAIRIATDLLQQDGLNRTTLFARWPGVPEKEVAARASLLFEVTDNMRLQGKNQSGDGINLLDFPEYLEMALPEESRERYCLRYLVQAEKLHRGAEESIVHALAYQPFADHLRESCAGWQQSNVAMRQVGSLLSAGIGRDALLYHQLLWCSAWEGLLQLEEKSLRDSLETFLKACDSEAIAPETTNEHISRFLSAPDIRFNGLPPLTEEQKLHALLIRYLARYTLDRINSITGRMVPEELSLLARPAELPARRSMPDSVWTALIDQFANTGKLDVDGCWHQAESWLLDHRTLRTIKEPYQRYLQHVTGRALARGASGELSHLRKYQVGDDLRLLDHKATARNGNPLVRVLEEKEVRHYDIVYDADLIYESDPNYSDSSYNSAIVDLFTHLNLAELQGATVDLWIPTRGKTLHFESILSVREHGDPPYFRTAAFRAELGGMLEQYFSLQETEQEWPVVSVREQNILRDVGTRIPAGHMVVCRIHPENWEASIPAGTALQRKGAQIALLSAEIGSSFYR